MRRRREKTKVEYCLFFIILLLLILDIPIEAVSLSTIRKDFPEVELRYSFNR